jgi:tetratricopeptide (TPR) repeat protein
VFFAEAELAFAHGDQQSAGEALQKVQLLERDYPYSPARLGQIAMAEGDAAAAERHFSDAAQLHYGPWRDLLNRGIARLQQGKHEQAREDAVALLAQLPDEAEVQLFAYQAYANQDDLSQARGALERALQLDPDHASAQLALARMELQSGNIAGAESLSRTALKLQPAYTPARELLALLLLDQKRPNEALEIIQPAVEADPENARLKRILAYCYFETQRYDDLSALDEQLENHLDRDAYTGFSRGLRLLASGEMQEAIDLIGPTVAIRADDLEPYDPLELDLLPTPVQPRLVEAETPDETVAEVVSVAAVEAMATVDSPLPDLVALPGPVTVAVSTIEEPVTVVSQPQITDIEPAVVSVQVPPPDLPPAPSEQASPPEAPPIEVGLVVETPMDEAVEETPAAPLPNTDAKPDSIALSRVENFVRDWAAAWSRQDVEAYLLHYADDFRPADGTSHAMWKDQRRERLMRPRSISVEISELEVIPLDEQHVEARFVQAYRANHYRDRVSKALYLMRVGGDWRIVQEVSL